MQTVKVEYTVQESYTATNKENINQVMKDLRALNNPGILYASYVKEDGVSFVHLASYPDQKTADIIPNLESFKKFQTELKASGLVTPPTPEALNLVASSFDFF